MSSHHSRRLSGGISIAYSITDMFADALDVAVAAVEGVAATPTVFLADLSTGFESVGIEPSVPWKLGGHVFHASWVGTCSMEAGWERVPWNLGGNTVRGTWVGTCSVKLGWERVP